MSTKKAKEPRPRKKKSPSAKALLESGRAAYMAADFTKAMAIWLPLAEAGNAEAQAWIGSLYANGDGVDVDDKAAFAWYLKSAEGGNVQAQNNIGAMYAMGNGVAENPQAAVDWFERAAEAGDAHSQFNLAVLLSEGKGVAMDLAKAAKWYRAASENGHYPSQAAAQPSLVCSGRRCGAPARARPLPHAAASATRPLEIRQFGSDRGRRGCGIGRPAVRGVRARACGDASGFGRRRAGLWRRAWRRRPRLALAQSRQDFVSRKPPAGGGNRPPEFLSTHPNPDTRIKDLNAAMPEAMKYYKK